MSITTEHTSNLTKDRHYWTSIFLRNHWTI